MEGIRHLTPALSPIEAEREEEVLAFLPLNPGRLPVQRGLLLALNWPWFRR